MEFDKLSELHCLVLRYEQLYIKMSQEQKGGEYALNEKSFLLDIANRIIEIRQEQHVLMIQKINDLGGRRMRIPDMTLSRKVKRTKPESKPESKPEPDGIDSDY